MRTLDSGACLISNTESFGILTSSDTSGDTFYNVELLYPTNSIFTWLGGVAVCWQRYRWRKLCIWYESVCATAMPGEVAYGLLYDALDASETSWTVDTILVISGSRRGNLWALPGATHYDSRRATLPWYPVSTGTDTTLGNINTPVSLVVAGYSSMESATLGRMMCSYEVEMLDTISSTDNVVSARSAVGRRKDTVDGVTRSLEIVSMDGSVPPGSHAAEAEVPDEGKSSVYGRGKSVLARWGK